ncbi:MAG: hypothetical protein WD425_16190 [Nitrospirales bacterium]
MLSHTITFERFQPISRGHPKIIQSVCDFREYFILTEMRQLLQAVHRIVTGVSQLDQDQGRTQAAAAARSAGMVMALDDNPTLILKLPLPMKQIGMSVHRGFDELADTITEGATSQQILQRLSTIMTRCLACHEAYQLKEG